MKRISLYGVLILLIFITFYPQTFLNFLATCSVQVYSLAKWGKPLKYEKLDLKGHRLVIVRPQLDHDSSFYAEHLILDFAWKWKCNVIDLAIYLDRPHWHIQTLLTNRSGKWGTLLKQSHPWLKTRTDIYVQRGRLDWASPLSTQSICFDIEANDQEGGWAKVYFDLEDFTDHYMVLKAFHTEMGITVDCNCQTAHAPTLFALTQFLGLGSLDQSIVAGTLEGQMKGVFAPTKAPYLEGEMWITQLAFLDTPKALKGQIEQARLKASLDESNAFVGQLELLKSASITCGEAQVKWELTHIHGNIYLDNDQTAFLNLQAQGGLLQWDIQGKVQLGLQGNVNAICSFNDSSRGRVNLSFQCLQNGSQRTTWKFQDFSDIEWTFLQKCMGIYWPVIHGVNLINGKFNALVETETTKQRQGEIWIKQLEVLPLNLHKQESNLQLQGFTLPLPVKEIDAHFFIQKSQLERTAITFEVADLKGKMAIEQAHEPQRCAFQLEGMLQNLAKLLPRFLQEEICQEFGQDQIILSANMAKRNRLTEWEGTLQIQGAPHLIDQIHFGGTLKKIESHGTVTYFPNGWFHSEHFPLVKFLAPLLFPKVKLNIEGKATCMGTVDDQFLNLSYHIESLNVENEHFCLEMKPLGSQRMGFHQIQLRDYAHQGTLSVQGASCLHKESGIVFREIQGMVSFNNQLIDFDQLEADGEGVYFAGHGKLDCCDPMPGVFDLTLHFPTVIAKVSQVQHLLARLDPSSFVHAVPLEGELSTHKEGLVLHFHFIPQDYALQARFQGAVTDGLWSFEDANFALKGLDLHLDYQHQQQTLDFSAIQGTLLVGKPRQIKEYLLTSPYICFREFAKPDVEWDIAVHDQGREFLRVVGYTQEEGEGVKKLCLDPTLSHFSVIYPQVWQCRVKDWSQVEQFKLCSQFDIGAVLQDLNYFCQPGWLCLPTGLIEQVTPFLTLEGVAFLEVSQQLDQVYTYELKGPSIKKDQLEHTLFLKGSKREQKWIIDCLNWDDWHVYGELQQKKDRWKIPFWGLEKGHALLLGLEGEWLVEEGLLQARLPFCEANLAELQHWKLLESFGKHCQLKGHLKASGAIEWTSLPSDPWEGLKMNLIANGGELTLKDEQLHVLQPFHVTYQAKQKIAIRHLQLVFLPYEHSPSLDFNCLKYCLLKNCIEDLQVEFQIPRAHVEKTTELLHAYAPTFLISPIKAFFTVLKPQQQLKGFFSARPFSNAHKHLSLKLEEGVYQFQGRDYTLRQFGLDATDQDMQFSFFSQHERCSLQVKGQAQGPAYQQGSIVLLSLDTFPPSALPLTIKWENHLEKGILIHSIQGEFQGCSVFLDNKTCLANAKDFPLSGRITFDFKRLSPLLTTELASKLEKLKINSLYSFIGEVWLKLEDPTRLWSHLACKGKLLSQEARLDELPSQRLQANLQYVPGRLDVQDLEIKGAAGSLKAPHLKVFFNDQTRQWMFAVPDLAIKNVQLCLLKEFQKHVALRSLVLKHLNLQTCSGQLNDLQTWQAKGRMHFLNPLSKACLRPLLPSTCSPQLLYPATGTIDFHLQEKRLYLTHFKDVYSEGRRSKFSLVQSLEPSWIDLEGNFSIRMRLKCYPFISKMTEFFTLCVQGNMANPCCALQPFKEQTLKTAKQFKVTSLLKKSKKAGRG